MSIFSQNRHPSQAEPIRVEYSLSPPLSRPSLSTPLSLTIPSSTAPPFYVLLPSLLLHPPDLSDNTAGLSPPPYPAGGEAAVRRQRPPLRQIWREGRRRPGGGPWWEMAGGKWPAPLGGGGGVRRREGGGPCPSVAGGSVRRWDGGDPYSSAVGSSVRRQRRPSPLGGVRQWDGGDLRRRLEVRCGEGEDSRRRGGAPGWRCDGVGGRRIHFSPSLPLCDLFLLIVRCILVHVGVLLFL